MLSPGTQLGPYEVVALLGAGGMGEVYRARDARLNREVAVKVLPPQFSRDADRLRRFEQEARAAGALNHPNIVAVYDLGTHDQSPYVISELLEGQTLRQRLSTGPLPERKVLDYAVQAGRGLAAAHDKGIAHRDLKPENIFLTRGGHIKLLDFGLAKLVEPKSAGAGENDAATVSTGTQPGLVMGTTSYMSPEQVRGEPVGLASDIFSFGSVVYELLSGRRAFQKPTAIETMHAILREEPAEIPPERAVSPALQRIVYRCLEKDPAHRFHSAHDLALMLEALAGVSGPGTAAVVTPTPRHWSRWWPAAAAVLALAGIFALLLPSPPPSPPRFTPLATSEALEFAPAWAPNSRTIAYAADVGGVMQIFTRSIGSSMSTQITRLAEDCLYPFWSSDATQIFFHSHGGLWRVGAAGGDPEEVLRDVAAATLSPDGKTLAFFRRGVLWIASPISATPAQYGRAPFATRGFTPYSHLQFSPDGRQIGAWISLRNGKSEFWLIPNPRGEPRAVFPELNDTPVAREFSWMPDSRRVVFAEATVFAAKPHLWIGDTRSGRIRQLIETTGAEQAPAVSPDGRYAAFAAMDSSYDLVEVPVDGSPMRELLATTRNEITGSWSPSGTQFAYVTDRSGAPEIWLKNRLEASERPLVTQRDFGNDRTVYIFDVAFSPDGQRIAYRRAGQHNEAIWISSLAGDPPVRLVQEPDEWLQRGPVWSPDGSWIAYYSARDGENRPMKSRVGGAGPPVALSEREGHYPRWSPKGDLISFTSNAGVVLVPAAGGPAVEAGTGRWIVQGWSADGARTYGLRFGPGRRLQLVALDLATRQEKVVGDLGPLPPAAALDARKATTLFRGFSLAADGKSFMTSIYRAKSDIWLLELPTSAQN